MSRVKITGAHAFRSPIDTQVTTPDGNYTWTALANQWEGVSVSYQEYMTIDAPIGTEIMMAVTGSNLRSSDRHFAQVGTVDEVRESVA